MKGKNKNSNIIPFYQVDSFADNIFSGNPAAVCLLDDWLDDATLQNIAMENNLSETAFVVNNLQGYHLRWFTPIVEVDLCGHATLAAASVLFSREANLTNSIDFNTRSGLVQVKKNENDYSLIFPQVTPIKINEPDGLLEALGYDGQVDGIWQASDIIIMVKNEQAIDRLQPDFKALKKYQTRGVIVCSLSEKYDFRLRWFGPNVGVNEDPATGSAFTFLAPLWQRLFCISVAVSLQGGDRKGIVRTEIIDEQHVVISGNTRLVKAGVMYLD